MTLVTNRTGTMQREMNEAPPEYSFAGMTVFDTRFGGNEAAVGGHEHLVDVVQRLDLRLQALDLTLAVGDCLCYDTHGLSQGAVSSVARRALGSGPSAFQWVPF